MSEYYGTSVTTEESDFFNRYDLSTVQINTYIRSRFATKLLNDTDGSPYLYIDTLKFRIPFRRKPIQLLRQKATIFAMGMAGVAVSLLSTAILPLFSSTTIKIVIIIALISSLAIYTIAILSLAIRDNPAPLLKKHLRAFLRTEEQAG